MIQRFFGGAPPIPRNPSPQFGWRLIGAAGFGLMALAMASFALVVAGSGDMGRPVMILAIIALIFVGPRLLAMPIDQSLSFLVFLMLILDVPGNGAFHHIDPITEILGGIFLFNSLGNTLGIPGLSILPIDMLTYVLFGIALFLYLPKLSVIGLLQSEKKLVFRAGGAFMLALGFGLFWGMIKGHNPYLIFLQLRFMIYIYFWLIIGFLGFTQRSQATVLLNTITLAMVVKSVLAIYIYWTELYDFADLDYLVDHHASVFWSVAMVYLFARGFLWSESTLLRIACFALISLMAFPFLLNDRRTSYLGIGFTFAFLLFILKKKPLQRLAKTLAIGFPAYTIFLIRNWAKNKDTNPVDYRDLENFNLYHLIAQNPFLGNGFGKRFEIIAPMPDISMFYPLFDLIPHNTMLALWGYGGPFAIAALASLVTIGLIAAVTLIRYEEDRFSQLFGVAALSAIIQWVVFSFADLAMVEVRSTIVAMLFIGISLGLSFRNLRQHAGAATS